jgi:hypothetical protein
MRGLRLALRVAAVRLKMPGLPNWWHSIPEAAAGVADLLAYFYDGESDDDPPLREVYPPHSALRGLVLDAIERLRVAEMGFAADELHGVQIPPPEPPLDDIERLVVRARLSSARRTDASLVDLCDAFAALPPGIPKRSTPLLSIEERRALLHTPTKSLQPSREQEAAAELIITLVDHLEERYGFSREETYFALELLRQQEAGA